VLKTIGFTNVAVFALTLAEAIAICLVAAGAGLAMATLVFPLVPKFFNGLSMPWIIIAVGLISAVAVALASAAVPAVMAARLEVATALVES